MSAERQKNGSRSSSKHSTNVWSGTLASRCDRRPAAPRDGRARRRRRRHSPAALRQIVGPPAHDASKLETSMAPSTMRSRSPLQGHLALAGARPGCPSGSRTSRIQRRSLVQRQGSSNQRMSRSATSRPNSTACGPLVALVGVDHEREVRVRPPRARRAPAAASSAGRPAADLELHAGEAAAA